MVKKGGGETNCSALPFQLGDKPVDQASVQEWGIGEEAFDLQHGYFQ